MSEGIEGLASVLQKLLDERYEQGRVAGYEAGFAKALSLVEFELVRLRRATNGSGVETTSGAAIKGELISEGSADNSRLALTVREAEIVRWVGEHPGSTGRQIVKTLRCSTSAPYDLLKAGFLTKDGTSFYAAPGQ